MARNAHNAYTDTPAIAAGVLCVRATLLLDLLPRLRLP